MYQNTALQTYLDTSSSINSQSRIIAEWNLNVSENILAIGNYRNRPTLVTKTEANYGIPALSYDPLDVLKAYTGATDADVTIDGGIGNDDASITYTSKNAEVKLLFSLEDCFGKFRPRSGINKLTFFSGKWIDEVSSNVVDRPRYYVAHKDDKFKYWKSFRTESNGTVSPDERGISKIASDGKKYIDDASPFVVYNSQIPANRIVIKLQTHVGTSEKVFKTSAGTITDPFYNMTTNGAVPLIWKVQYLDSFNVWQTLKSFSDTTPIFAEDGYLELAYGITNLDAAITAAGISSSQFYFAGEYLDSSLLPISSILGYTYLVKDPNNVNAGTYYIWNGTSYTSFVPTYGWYIKSSEESNLTDYFNDLTSPPSYGTGSSQIYRNLQYIKGLRLVVDTMNVADATLDLIELSPRLSVDLTERVSSFNITKSASDLGSSGIPVGQLLSSTGNIEVFDYDQAFNKYNADSILNVKDDANKIISTFATKNLQIKLYDVFFDDSNNSYIVPLKTMYVDGFPESNNTNRQVSLSLKDLYFYFESITAPEMLLQNQPVSFVIASLLDNIGFSNYAFKRNSNENSELTIPYFFIGPNTSVAQVLSDIAVSAQMATFFDESNNLIFMSRDYLMPSKKIDGTYDRSPDATLYGSTDAQRNAVYENQTIGNLANIIDIRSETADIYTDGKITYTSRSIQKSVSTISQAGSLADQRSYSYKPVVLWEVAPTDNLTSMNTDVTKASAYSLSALVLSSTLTATVPYVDASHDLQNNIIDFGESIYWISRYSGYFQANGEIIKYDAVQYSITGYTNPIDQSTNAWISSTQEYTNYFSKLPFGGKMYPTGKIRIYSEPYYDSTNNTLKIGTVAKHGRGQFGTTIVDHYAKINDTWLSPDNVRVCLMKSSNLFNNVSTTITQNISAGLVSGNTYFPSRTEFIKNSMSSTYRSESEINVQKSVEVGTIRSSALTIDGSSASDGSANYLSYVYKPMDNKYVHFGTRLRIIGGISSDPTQKLQTPTGSSAYYNKINGAGGGLAIMINPKTNNGYYFEIGALTDQSVNQYLDGSTNLNNIFFYKLGRGVGSSSTDAALPINLFQASANILVDDGTYSGQNRFITETNPSVYDLAVEYEWVGSSILRFHLYLNNKYLTTVEDKDPLTQKGSEYNNMALFVRGSSKLMFEHVYAINNNYSKNSGINYPPLTYSLGASSSSDQLRKYSISGAIQETYLNGILSTSSPKYSMYYDEFGTIMREAAYFNIKYDKAFPALYARLADTTNDLQGYSVSGFTADPYGAEFLIFNTTDKVLNLDSSTGNFLKIYGITFTQQSDILLTVDDYFSQKGDLSNPQFDNGTFVNVSNDKTYSTIKSSRLTYGKKEFAINAPYIQNQDNAYDLMGWMISKIGKQKRNVAIQAFANSTIQLGDILNIDYINSDGVTVFSSNSSSDYYTTFVVYCIEYSKSSTSSDMILYLSEVV